MIDYLPALLVSSVCLTILMFGFEFFLMGIRSLTDWLMGSPLPLKEPRSALGGRPPQG